MVRILSVILGIVMIIGGIYCVAMPDLTFLMLGYIIGIGMLLDGIVRIITWFMRDKGTEGSGWMLASAILSLILGIVMIGNDILQLAVDSFIVHLTIAWLLILGVMRIVHAFQVRKLQDSEVSRNWWIALVLGILLVICGIIGLFVPAAVAETIGLMIGIFIMISGVNLISVGTLSWM